MSWKENANKKELIIVTGDKRQWNFLHKNPQVSMDVNAVALEYNDIPGADVKRGEVGPRIFGLRLYLQGEDHLSEASRFLESVADRKPWQMEHPYYGTIICHPYSSVDFNNINDNVTEITLKVYETIEVTQEVLVNSKYMAAELTELAINATVDSSVAIEFEAEDLAVVGQVAEKAGNRYRLVALTDLDLSTVNEAIYKFEATLNTIGATPVQIMKQFSMILRAPSRFYDTITNRIDVIVETYNDLKAAARGLKTFAMKQFFENAAGMMLMAVADTVLNTKKDIGIEQDIEEDVKSDLNTRSSVLYTIARLKTLEEDYLEELNTNQSDDDNKLDSYFPNYDTINQVKKAISKASGNLLSISKDAKVERSYYVDTDISLIRLCHKLYGSYDDEYINRIIDDNNLKLNQLLIIENGLTIKYYV